MPFQKVEIELEKMASDYDSEVIYYLRTKTGFIVMNDLIGRTISFQFLKTKCQSCGEALPLFRQGYCKKCFFESPETADWIMKPELSQAHLGIEYRDLEFEKKTQLQPHIVYISDTGQPKVGITRKTQKLYRWIDQGAIQALVLMELPNRYLAGVAEVFFKQHLSDKTSWQKMLMQTEPSTDLEAVREGLKSLQFPQELQNYGFLEEEPITLIKYPGESNPETKPKQLKINEDHVSFSSNLCGIKGQYLLFEKGEVLNVRAHSGVCTSIDF